MSRITRRTLILVTATVVAGIGVGVGVVYGVGALTAPHDTSSAAATTTADPPAVLLTADDRFFADLDRASVPYAQARKGLVVEDGHEICNELTSGRPYTQVLAGRTSDAYGVPKVAAAIDAYCPQFKQLLN